MYVEYMKKQLQEAFSPSQLEVIDESYKHVGHKGAGKGGHYKVRIVAEAFANKSRIEKHRMIYKIFDNDMPDKIHALAIDASN